MDDPKRYRLRFWRDFDEMMDEMDKRFRELMGRFESQRLLPAPGFQRRLVPAYQGTFTIDIKDHEDEVVVVADLPGATKEDITINLIDPRTLNICFKREEEKEEQEKGYYLQERVLGQMERTVTLPTDITTDESKATFKNGILELRLKKIQIAPEKRILIE
ncbi:MAG: Hsp20/alpha crystallin family protein [Methanomicrobiales archaeon]|nr:Hsp20/alpha crystallin family protein [Methanomicrobiales archaeon]